MRRGLLKNLGENLRRLPTDRRGGETLEWAVIGGLALSAAIAVFGFAGALARLGAF